MELLEQPKNYDSAYLQDRLINRIMVLESFECELRSHSRQNELLNICEEMMGIMTTLYDRLKQYEQNAKTRKKIFNDLQYADGIFVDETAYDTGDIDITMESVETVASQWINASGNNNE